MPASRQKQLNRCMPAAADAKLGDVLADLITAHNALAVKHNSVCTKLDADAGVTDTNYSALHAVSGTTLAVTDLESR